MRTASLAHLDKTCTDPPWNDATPEDDSSERTEPMTPRIAGQDRRDKFISLRSRTAGDIARVTAAAATRGITPSRWAGDALIAALEDATGWSDQARRPAPRRPNRQDRQGKRQGKRLDIKVSAEEHDRITDLAGGKGQVTDWAWIVLGTALEKEN